MFKSVLCTTSVLEVSPAKQLLIQQVGFVNSRHFFQHRSHAKLRFKNQKILESRCSVNAPKKLTYMGENQSWIFLCGLSIQHILTMNKKRMPIFFFSFHEMSSWQLLLGLDVTWQDRRCLDPKLDSLDELKK